MPSTLLIPLSLLLGSPVGSRVTCELGSEGGGLSLAGGGLLELRVATQVLERLAGVEVHAERLDVGGGERLKALCALGADAGSERADVAQVHLVALQHQLAHTHAQLGEHTYDGALGEHAVVFGDVIGEFVDVDDTRQLQVGVSLLRLFGLHGICLQSRAVLNLFHGFFRGFAAV